MTEATAELEWCNADIIPVEAFKVNRLIPWTESALF